MRTLLLLALAGASSAANSSCSANQQSLYSSHLVASRGGQNATVNPRTRLFRTHPGCMTQMDSFNGKVSLVINVASF